MKIIISGGHLTPALSVIDYIQAQHPEITAEFIGRVYSQQSSKQLAHEKQEISSRNIPFHSFSASRSSNTSLLSKILSPIVLVQSFFKALILIIKIRPDVFLSFGSYLSVPLGYACWVLRVPIVTHEQTKTIGRATKALIPFAKKVAVSFPHMKKKLPQRKTVVTGNPIRKKLTNKTVTKPTWMQKKVSKPILYITGGSQGSEIINTTTRGALKHLLKQFIVIHQCGSKTNNRNYKAELEATRRKLPLALQKNYYVQEWLSDTDLAWILSKASCAVSRSGANTVFEMMVKEVPTVFIPLPFSINNEQFLNAKALQRKKAAVILEQKNLNPETLVAAVKSAYKKRKSIAANLSTIPYIKNAEEKIVSLLFEVGKKTAHEST